MTILAQPRSAAQSGVLIASALRHMDDAAYLHAVRTGQFDTGARIPTFEEFDGRKRREVAERFGIDFIDTYRYLHDDGLQESYIEYIAGRFDRGAFVPNFIWKLLSTKGRRLIAQTLRGHANSVSASQNSVADAVALRLNALGDPVFG